MHRLSRDYSSKGPRFGFQHPQRKLTTSLTPCPLLAAEGNAGTRCAEPIYINKRERRKNVLERASERSTNQPTKQRNKQTNQPRTVDAAMRHLGLIPHQPTRSHSPAIPLPSALPFPGYTFPVPPPRPCLSALARRPSSWQPLRCS